MSSNVPPGDPGSAGNGPEYLESGAGRPLQPPPGGPASGGGRRTALVAGGAIGVVVLLGAATWAAWSFFATGPQPADALPDSTIAYASVDLDPSGGQKIEALQTLREFPAFEDKIGLDTDDDIRQRIFEEIQASGACDDLDYGEDVEPWLGDRMAVAAVDTGEDEPVPVFVLQVTDEDAAGAGLEAIRACSGENSGAWAVNDEWALVSESQDVVDGIAADAADAPLSEDGDYTRWTDEAGDGGIATAYVAPAAADYLADELLDLRGVTDPEARSQASETLDGFEGLAATLRFDDGGLELEVASSGSTSERDLAASGEGGKAVASLPEDTVAALGLGMPEKWFTNLIGGVADAQGGSVDELMEELSAETGLDLPEDAETLAGESVALALGAGFEPEALLWSPEGSDTPAGIGVRIRGDADEIESVLEKVRTAAGAADAGLLDSDGAGDVVAVGPDADYRAQLLEGGGLGDSETFERVVEEADNAAVVLFVDFDGGDDWLVDLVGDDQEVRDNVDPLDALGLSLWQDVDAMHAVLKVTTD